MDWIPVLEYLQMAGRAGRPEYEKFGEAIAIAKDDFQKNEIYHKYVLGEPEEIYSKLNVEPVLRMYLLSLISSGLIKDEKSMKSFFSKTFWAAQYDDMDELESTMQKILNMLWRWRFITINSEEASKENEEDDEANFTAATKTAKKSSNSSTNLFQSGLNLLKPNKFQVNENNTNTSNNRSLRSTSIGRRVSELYLDPLTAYQLIKKLNVAKQKKKTSKELTPFSYLQMISHTLEMRPLLRIKVKEQNKIQSHLLEHYEALLEQEPDQFDLDYDEFMNSIKTAAFFQRWIEEEKEETLLEDFGIRPGEIRAKLETANWLIYACTELLKELNNKELRSDLIKLRIRVKSGVKEELLTLLKLRGIGRKRARKLHNNNIKDLRDLKAIDQASLTQLLGPNLAKNIKEQLGQEAQEPVKKGKRKGQMGLLKYA